MSFEEDTDEFTRLHRIFTFHLGVAVALAWMTAIYACLYAPWVRNIRPLLDPSSVDRVESTWSFLFGMPIVLSVAWIVVITGRDMLRQLCLFKNYAFEFALAAFVAFGIFYLSIDRAVAAILLGL